MRSICPTKRWLIAGTVLALALLYCLAATLLGSLGIDIHFTR